MKAYFIGSFIVALLFMPISIVVAEDDSCELKDESKKSQVDGKTNEFTRDKTWHFKADKILQKGSAMERDANPDISNAKPSKDAVKI